MVVKEKFDHAYFVLTLFYPSGQPTGNYVVYTVNRFEIRSLTRGKAVCISNHFNRNNHIF